MAECVEDRSALAFIGQQIHFFFQRVKCAEDVFVLVCMCLHGSRIAGRLLALEHLEHGSIVACE